MTNPIHITKPKPKSAEKAAMLNTFFGKCFNNSLPPLGFPDLDEMGHTDQCPKDFLCTVEEVQWLTNRLDTAKSNGPDGISARILKAVAPSIAPSLTKLFNLSIASACFLTMWKIIIFPVPKSNNHTSPSNYRPISLLPTLSKLLEQHIHFLLTEHLSLHHPISCSQWGFSVENLQLLHY